MSTEYTNYRHHIYDQFLEKLAKTVPELDSMVKKHKGAMKKIFLANQAKGIPIEGSEAQKRMAGLANSQSDLQSRRNQVLKGRPDPGRSYGNKPRRARGGAGAGAGGQRARNRWQGASEDAYQRARAAEEEYRRYARQAAQQEAKAARRVSRFKVRSKLGTAAGLGVALAGAIGLDALYQRRAKLQPKYAHYKYATRGIVSDDLRHRQTRMKSALTWGAGGAILSPLSDARSMLKAWNLSDAGKKEVARRLARNSAAKYVAIPLAATAAGFAIGEAIASSQDKNVAATRRRIEARQRARALRNR